MMDSRWRWISFFCRDGQLASSAEVKGTGSAHHDLSNLGVGVQQGLLKHLEAVSQKLADPNEGRT